MKKLLFLLLIFVACKKESTQPNQTTNPLPPQLRSIKYLVSFSGTDELSISYTTNSGQTSINPFFQASWETTLQIEVGKSLSLGASCVNGYTLPPNSSPIAGHTNVAIYQEGVLVAGTNGYGYQGVSHVVN